MTKIMSLSLTALLCGGNYVIGSERQILQQANRVVFSGSYGSKSGTYNNANIEFIDSSKYNSMSATLHNDANIGFTDSSRRNSLIATLHDDTKIRFTDSSGRNFVQCDVLPSVKKIIINAHDSASYNNVVINMPFYGEMPEVTCNMKDASKRNDVTIYSFQDVKVNYSDKGHCNSCRVVSPLRKLIMPILAVAILHGGYQMISSE